jgi:uncharacterized membrane protein
MKLRNISRLGIFAILLFTVCAGRLLAHGNNKHPSPAPQAANTASSTPAAPVEAKTEQVPMNMVEDFPNYHPLVVHFPIVLLIFAAVFQVLSFFVYRKEFSFATLILLLIGTISVWLSSNTFHAHPMNLPEHVSEMYATHELMAKYTWWLALAALAAKGISHFFNSRKWWSEAVVLILLVGASITVSIAGHHGAQLVHMGGVGPQGKYLEAH